jgi:hypothetical protein
MASELQIVVVSFKLARLMNDKKEDPLTIVVAGLSLGIFEMNVNSQVRPQNPKRK